MHVVAFLFPVVREQAPMNKHFSSLYWFADVLLAKTRHMADLDSRSEERDCPSSGWELQGAVNAEKKRIIVGFFCAYSLPQLESPSVSVPLPINR